MSGSIETFDSCEAIDDTVYIILDERFNSGMIQIHVYNILNFDMGTSKDFLVSTSYDSEYLDVSSTGSSL